MNKFEARSTLGSEAVPVFDDDGELTEWLHRDNYTVEELELMNFVGKEKPVINKDGVTTGQGISYHQYNFPINLYHFNENDSIHIMIRHDMKREILPGISDIGIKLEKR